MNLELRRLQRITMLMLMAAALAACGGGGDDDEDDEEVEDEDATGLWLGSFTQAGASRPFNVMVAPNGEFFGLVAASSTAPSRFMMGTGDVTQNILNATGTVFAPNGATLPNSQTTAPLTIAAGRVTTGVSMTGNYSAAGEIATFSLNFDNKTNRGASTTAMSGVYSQFPAPPNPAQASVLTVNGNVITYATGSGCNGSGTMAVLTASINLYSWTLDMPACNGVPALSFAGLATLGDPAGGTANTMMVLFGASTIRDRGFVFAGTK